MNDLVTITDQKAVTTSLIVAETFEKLHKNVLQNIERIECSNEFRRLNFQPSSYLNEQNKQQPMYNITRDGFTFIAMGFTGKKAAQFKEAFIAAFNRMEQALLEGAGEHKRVDVNMNHTRGITNPHGLDIKYNLDLTKIIQHPNRAGLSILERLTGVEFSDIIERFPQPGGPAASVALFSKEMLIETPGERVSVAAVYAAYLTYCATAELKPLDIQSFGNNLRRIHPEITRGKSLGPEQRVSCYCNLQLLCAPIQENP